MSDREGALCDACGPRIGPDGCCSTGRSQDAEIARLRAEMERRTACVAAADDRRSEIPRVERERDEAVAQVAALIDSATIASTHIICMGGKELCQPCLNRDRLCMTLQNLPAEARALLDQITNRESQIKRLADFILANMPGEPSRSEGAVDTTIRLLDRLQQLEEHHVV